MKKLEKLNLKSIDRILIKKLNDDFTELIAFNGYDERLIKRIDNEFLPYNLNQIYMNNLLDTVLIEYLFKYPFFIEVYKDNLKIGDDYVLQTLIFSFQINQTKKKIIKYDTVCHNNSSDINI